MTNPLIQIGDDVREMTKIEFDQWKKDNKEIVQRTAAADAKATARASALAKLADLGLTAEEIAAL
jgi:hypothetical protein